MGMPNRGSTNDIKLPAAKFNIASYQFYLSQIYESRRSPISLCTFFDQTSFRFFLPLLLLPNGGLVGQALTIISAKRTLASTHVHIRIENFVFEIKDEKVIGKGVTKKLKQRWRLTFIS